MYKNIYDTPEEIEVSFSVSDTSLYRLPLGRMFTTHEIWTGTGKTGTQLVAGTDYIAGGESARAGEIKGESVYTGFQITNAGYHSTTLYATIYWVGTIVNAEVKNGKGIETITATTYTIDDFGLDVYEVNNGECTVTLPDLARWQGREITVWAITDATTGISIEAAGSDVITRADLTDVSLTSDGDFWVFFAGSTRWELVDGYESGEDATNGDFIKKNTGEMTCTNKVRLSYFSADAVAETWTFQEQFSDVPKVGHTPLQGALADAPGVSTLKRGAAFAGAVTTLEASLRNGAISGTYASGNFIDTYATATGRWYD